MSAAPQLYSSPVLESLGMVRVGPPRGQAPVPGEALWKRVSVAEVIQHAARRGLAAEVRRVNKEGE